MNSFFPDEYTKGEGLSFFFPSLFLTTITYCVPFFLVAENKQEKH